MTTANPTHRPFAWFNATQFLGALNDNLFRWLAAFFLIAHLGKENSDRISQIIGVVFVVPFLLFTPWAGKLTDHFSKQRIIVLAKVAELGIMLLGCTAMFLDWTWAAYGILFLMCTQSAFFGPAKYGIVPELVRPQRLSNANALLEGFTYIAVVIGTALAAGLVQTTGGHYGPASLCSVGISVVGLIVSLRIPFTPAACDPATRLRYDRATFGIIGRDKALALAVVGSAYFMHLGGMLQINLIPYSIHHLELAQEKSGYLFLLSAVGIGIGSWWAGRLSGRNVEIGIVPLGAIGLAAGSLSLGLAQHLVSACLGVLVMGISAGLFIVPLNALLQLRCPREKLGQVLAISGFIGWIGVLLAALVLMGLTSLGLSTSQIFWVLGIETIVLAGIALWQAPDFFVRFLIIMVVKSLYRIRTLGDDYVPISGPAVLIPNHASWVDALLVGATQQRRVRFVMSREIFQASKLRWLFKLLHVILISEFDPPKQIVRSLKEARQALDDGYLVCIFAEGAITRTGMLQRFKPGFERIVRGTDAPIIPVYLGGVWGSIFSYAQGDIGGMPQHIPYPVTIHFGAALPTHSPAYVVRQRVQELSCADYDLRKVQRRPLGQVLIRATRSHWRRHHISDKTGKRLTHGQTLTASVLLADQLRPLTADPKHIGILLPPSIAGVLSNLAVALLNRVSVNLSYTATAEDRRYAVDHCGIQTVITSRQFLNKLGLEANSLPFVFIEDLLESLSSTTKLKAWLRARWLPRTWLCPAHGFQADDTAAILFSSGSTGQGKAICLSHHNLQSNLEQMRQVFHIDSKDHLCGVLPFFHSFGLTVTLWLPLVSGAAADYLPNPLDGKAVAESIHTHRSTILLATPSFLMMVMRRAQAEDLASLREIITGAEKLRPELADRFEKRFGIRPLEGYGATELSPLVSLNLKDGVHNGYVQVGHKDGSAGHPVPGLALKVVDLETQASLGPGQEGLLYVKGPNVMTGYYHDPERSAEVLHDGWYNTGDIVTLDEDGFIFITDRLSRFSKIAGEMVPHGNVEKICHQILDQSERVIAVTSIPDDKRGEELVVLYVNGQADPDQMHQALSQSNLSNLAKPKRENFIAVPDIPLLGSGKLDLKALKNLALAAKTGTRIDG